MEGVLASRGVFPEKPGGARAKDARARFNEVTSMTKLVRIPALAAVALILSACGATQPLVIDQPIGPYNEPARISNAGTLVVYSDTESLNGDPEYLVHTNYTVLTSEGALVRKVDNH